MLSDLKQRIQGRIGLAHQEAKSIVTEIERFYEKYFPQHKKLPQIDLTAVVTHTQLDMFEEETEGKVQVVMRDLQQVTDSISHLQGLAFSDGLVSSRRWASRA